MRPETARHALVLWFDRLDLACIPLDEAEAAVEAQAAMIIVREFEPVPVIEGGMHSNPRRTVDTGDD